MWLGLMDLKAYKKHEIALTIGLCLFKFRKGFVLFTKNIYSSLGFTSIPYFQ